MKEVVEGARVELHAFLVQEFTEWLDQWDEESLELLLDLTVAF
jgi:hypothetical protein